MTLNLINRVEHQRKEPPPISGILKRYYRGKKSFDVIIVIRFRFVAVSKIFYSREKSNCGVISCVESRLPAFGLNYPYETGLKGEMRTKTIVT